MGYDVGQKFPNVSKVAFIWLPNQVMAKALKTPKCIDFCLMMLEADFFDGERVSNGSDRNQLPCGLRFNSLNGHCWFPVAPFVRRCNLCNPPVLPCRGQAKLGEDHPQTLTYLNNLALLLKAQGHLAKAEPLYREALEKSPGAQLERFQRDFGQWIWGHGLLNCRWLIRFLGG